MRDEFGVSEIYVRTNPPGAPFPKRPRSRDSRTRQIDRIESKLSRLPTVSGRILIVDDDERQRAALTDMLAGCDFDIQVARDGREALERLGFFNADVIVSDLVMPRMDGFELLRHLRDRGDITPTIALTGFGSIEKALSVIHDL